MEALITQVLAAAAGLMRSRAALPPWLFYDARGSALFEEITRLPEYDLTRVEAAILRDNADAIVAAASPPLALVELGAGSGTKTQILLSAVVRAQGACRYVAIDVSATALQATAERLAREEPKVEVQTCVGTHEMGLASLGSADARWLALFIGSSIGNLEDAEAVDLLARIASAIGPGGALLLGTDRLKAPGELIAAYDDAAGVTAAFNLNILVRLNRELGADFEIARWRHEARWNAERSRIEMHLVSTTAQSVHVPRLGTRRFAQGESIHTESCHKYDRPHVDRLLGSAGFRRVHSWTDARDRFDVHLARC